MTFVAVLSCLTPLLLICRTCGVPGAAGSPLQTRSAPAGLPPWARTAHAPFPAPWALTSGKPSLLLHSCHFFFRGEERCITVPTGRSICALAGWYSRRAVGTVS